MNALEHFIQLFSVQPNSKAALQHYGCSTTLKCFLVGEESVCEAQKPISICLQNVYSSSSLLLLQRRNRLPAKLVGCMVLVEATPPDGCRL